MDKQQYEVILCIVNHGYSDLVMDVAKENGARGGTILHAKGTGNEEVEKFFGIVITPEKEIVMIIIEKEIKEKVLHAIYDKVGLSSPGQGIIFSLPISHVAGISTNETTKKEEH